MFDGTKFLAGSDGSIQHHLGATEGLDLSEPFKGTLKCGPRLADLTIEAAWIRVTLPLGEQPNPASALEANAALPGNVRFGGPSGALCLLADTRLDGVLHIPESIREIRCGLSQGSGHPPGQTGENGVLDAALVEEAFAALGKDSDAVVRRDDGWEFRPRMRGAVRPVRVAAEPGGLRLHRSILKSLPGGIVAEAVVREALRLNGALRFSRLSLCGGDLVVETRLRAALVHRRWIEVAGRAIAAAYAHCQVRLNVLCDDVFCSRCYLRVLG